LYNLEDDAVEQSNLVEEYPGIVSDLKKKYTSWRTEMGTPMSRKNRGNVKFRSLL